MTQVYYRSFYLLILLCIGIGVSGQSNILIDGTNRTVSACDGFFYDSGGPGGAHGASGVTQTITICPDGSTGASLRVFFSQLVINGTLTIINGNNTSAPELGNLTAADNGQPWSFRATASNVSGCLTFRFVGNGAPGPGWTASLSCVTSCQPIQAVILSTDPPREPDTAEGFVDICPGDAITLSATATYPENGTIYEQSNATSTFSWNFQDGTVLTGQTVTHTYEEDGGFQVDLLVTDERGCRNDTRVAQRVRITPPPIFDEPTNLPDKLCPNEELVIDLNATDGTALTINPTPEVFTFRTGQTFSEFTQLPDGNGDVFSSPLEFFNFDEGQQLTAGDQIVSICAEMEHSYLGDLDIWIECPDGNRLDLHIFDRLDQVMAQTLGDGRRESTMPDAPGTYCWTSDAPETMRQVVENRPVIGSEKMPEIDYAPEGGSFDDFVGCELNGEWTINVRDNIERDDGSIYAWSIEFSSDVFTDPEEFSVPITSVIIQDNSDFTSYSTDRAVMNSPNPGPKRVRIITQDGSNCEADTSFVINVASPFDPDCLDCASLPVVPGLDTSVCAGDSFQVDFSNAFPEDTLITWESIDFNEFSSLLYPAQTQRYESIITVADHKPNLIGDPGLDVAEVCLSLENAGDLNGLNLELINPGGEALRLVESLNSPGASLRETCFSLSATGMINSGAPPYSNTYLPFSTNWGMINGDNINGDWTLAAWADNGSNVSTFVKWSISLRYRRAPTYSWAPANAALSCTDCPNPTVTPAAPTNYILTISTAEGCEQEISVNVNFNALDLNVEETLTPPSCSGGDDGSIDLTIIDDPGDLTFSWSDDESVTTLDRTGLTAGLRTLTIMEENGCTQVSDYFLAPPPSITFRSENNSAECFGESNGSLRIFDISGPNPGNYTVQWGPEAGNQVTPLINNLAAGNYPVEITDVAGCFLDTFLVVSQPDTLQPTIEQLNVSCNGDSDGSLRVMGSGGNPPYTYTWSTGTTATFLSNLAVGQYILTLTDANLCESITTYEITEPDLLELTAVSDSVHCLGGFSGAANLVTTGGSAPFIYNLSSRGTSRNSLYLGLEAGVYPVNVTDANGCTALDTAVVEDGLPFSIDLGPDTTIVFGDSIVLSATSSGGVGGLFYEWKPSAPTSISCLDCPSPTIQPRFETDYTLATTDDNGCRAEDRIRVSVQKIREVAVPTGFSPDGNGQNEVLVVHGRPGTRILSFQVFDRWTNLLYEASDFPVNDLSRGWDGSKDGEPVNAGVYLYKLVVLYEDLSQETLTGQTTLVR